MSLLEPADVKMSKGKKENVMYLSISRCSAFYDVHKKRTDWMTLPYVYRQISAYLQYVALL